MLIHRAPADFRLAMSTHPEYDDQYWRYIVDLRGESARGPVTVTREDGSLWRIAGAAGDVTIRYRVHFPTSTPMQQASWKGHLTSTVDSLADRIPSCINGETGQPSYYHDLQKHPKWFERDAVCRRPMNLRPGWPIRLSSSWLPAHGRCS